MIWGILQPKAENVPGTALLDEVAKEKTQYDGADTSHLKKDRDGRTVLVPQPSDDPRDPLNWPILKRELCFWTLCFEAGLVGAIGPLISNGYADIALELGTSVNAVASSNGWTLIGLGVAMFFQSSIAVKFGRRPVFILGALMLFFFSIWSGVAKNNTSFTVSRALQGCGMAPYEALATATIGDLYFVHQRGLRITIWGFAIIGGISLAPIINGKVITSDLGWKWCFWLIAIFYGVAAIMVILFMPETVYDREEKYETDSGADAAALDRTIAHAHPADRSTTPSQADEKNEKEIGQIERAETSTRTYLPAKTFWEELRPWSGYYKDTPFWQMFFRPFPVALSPVVICGFFVYGMTTAWIVALSVASSIIFGGPPLNFSAEGVGYMSIGPFIASILGAFVTGYLLDEASKWLARKNNGVFEPEFRKFRNTRLILILPATLICLAGFLGWYGMIGKVDSWVGPEFMYSIIYFGNGLASTAIVSYIIDVHRKMAPEAFTIINFVKNMIIYGFTQFVANWVIDWGLKKIFGFLAGVFTLCLLFALPLWVFGKHIRLWISRHPELFTEKPL
ncbi:MFS general substrate transporter [Atractiella rhizophila]|nr:MFS general substrate transporter [Atractiella rhizophila]